MRINSKEERQKFLEMNIFDTGSYALVTYDGHTEAIWISNMGSSCNEDTLDETPWFLESPCCLLSHKVNCNTKEELSDYIKDIYDSYTPDGYKYALKQIKELIEKGTNTEIDSPQTAPFLPDVLDDITLISEDYCKYWMDENYKNK